MVRDLGARYAIVREVWDCSKMPAARSVCHKASR